MCIKEEQGEQMGRVREWKYIVLMVIHLLNREVF